MQGCLLIGFRGAQPPHFRSLILPFLVAYPGVPTRITTPPPSPRTSTGDQHPLGVTSQEVVLYKREKNFRRSTTLLCKRGVDATGPSPLLARVALTVTDYIGNLCASSAVR